MAGKLLAIAILLSAAVAGAALYYLQVYGFYYEVAPQPGRDVQLVPRGGGAPESIAYANFRAIDADSSPIRYRACFETEITPETLGQSYQIVDGIDVLSTPGWFDCFDEASLAAQLDAGTAQTFLGAKNIHYGIDRIVAVTETGQGFAWHVLNDCGHKAYDGTVTGEACPPRPEADQ